MDQFWHLYPDLASQNTGRHITGQEIPIPEEDLMVIGLAVCPTVLSSATELSQLACNPYIDFSSNWIHAVDTTIANRLTEYVQLYTLEGGTPQIMAEGAWRIEDTHRYLLFPNRWVRDNASGLDYSIPDTVVVPLYEVMFDTSVCIEYIENKTPLIMVAGTHNNNTVVWSQVACGEVYNTPRICYAHSLTSYSMTVGNIDNLNQDIIHYWIKYDTLPWYQISSDDLSIPRSMNIFPILDTVFGTPCATVSNLQAVEVDTLWATVMWSADARHHDWEVEYWPTGMPPDSATVVADSVPMVTLMGLMPGTEYGVRVRGRCDVCINNYSPWSDTLLFTTPQDTTPDTLPWVIPSTLDARDMGSLDRFTRMMPNPAGEVVNVLSSYRLESVAVYDLSGRLLLEQPAEGLSATLDVSALPRGTYIVAIRTLQGVATKKLVVER